MGVSIIDGNFHLPFPIIDVKFRFMSNTSTTETATLANITLHYPLAGAYKAQSYTRAIRSHGSINGSDPLCGSLKHELCDMEEGIEAQAKLCKSCATKIAKLLAAGTHVLKLA